jgi:hypothetical protein
MINPKYFFFLGLRGCDYMVVGFTTTYAISTQVDKSIILQSQHPPQICKITKRQVLKEEFDLG